MNTPPSTCETCAHWQRLASRKIGVCREEEEEAPLAHASYGCHRWEQANVHNQPNVQNPVHNP